jgi:2-polyprenyl-6-methoxyphenol hydroxylase-like FAD-dependent oxidoreductase
MLERWPPISAGERVEGRMSSSCRIAIVGVGLAGVAAVQALKTFGIQAELFEAAPALGEIGAAVNVSSQAIKALQAVGLGDNISQRAVFRREVGLRSCRRVDKEPSVPTARAA